MFPWLTLYLLELPQLPLLDLIQAQASLAARLVQLLLLLVHLAPPGDGLQLTLPHLLPHPVGVLQRLLPVPLLLRLLLGNGRLLGPEGEDDDE